MAVGVSTPEKVGKDAGELAGLDVVTGVTAVGDLDAVIAAEPECVVYCAMGDTRPVEATNDVRTLLEAGIDVVGSAPGTLQYPWGTMPDKVIEKVEAAARAGNASVYITGVDPGFASDLIPLDAGQHLPADRADHVLRARRLRDVRRRRGDVRPHGLRPAAHRDPDALPARRARASRGEPRSG